MYKTIILKTVREINDKVVICARINEKDVTYSIAKEDLNGVQLAPGKKVRVEEYPSSSGMVCALEVDGEMVFTKNHADVLDEYLNLQCDLLQSKLPAIAVARVKMFEKYQKKYLMLDKLHELLALYLGFKLYFFCEDEEDIDAFKKLRKVDRYMIYPKNYYLFPKVNIETIQTYAKAYLHDDSAEIYRTNSKDLLSSELMHLPNVNWEERGKFCEPRDKYIKKYIATL